MFDESANPSVTPKSPEDDSESSLHNPAMADRRPDPIFTILPNVNNETLLVHACETLASASVMASELAFILEGPKCNLALGIQQMIALAELSMNRVLDRLDPQE